MNKRKFITTVAGLVFAALVFACPGSSCGEASAQDVPPAPSRVALEITYYPGRKPAYQQVSASAEGSWAWYGLFARLEVPKVKAGPPIKAVHIGCQRKGDAVRVIVSLLSGEKTPDYKQQIAEYTLSEGEKITVQELRQFGIQPFEIKLIRTSPNRTAVPQVVLEGIQSLTLLNAIANDSTLPSYALTVANNSSKGVLALSVEVLANGRMQISALPRGRDGKPLIEAGANYELLVHAPIRARQVAGGYEPSTLADQEIHIKSVLFEDGTFEGAEDIATRMKRIRESEKRDLSKLIPVLDDALKLPAEDTSEALRALEQAVTLPTRGDDRNGPPQADVRPEETEKPAEDAKSTEVYSPPIIAELLTTIHRLQTKPSLNEGEYRAWLAATKERYEKWLSRL